MCIIYSFLLVLVSLVVFVMVEGNVFFLYMYGLKYIEYDEVKKFGLMCMWLLFWLDEIVIDKFESVCL